MKVHELSNGMRVVLAPMTGTKVVTMLVMFKVGSRNENKKTNGISHFLEHLFFKGTEHRPSTLAVTRELDAVGADYNAFTGKDYTGYYVKVANKHAGLAVDILEDLLFHPLFQPDEINRERGVIIEEINMYEDNPMATAEELAEQLLFGKEHPLGFLIAGPRENIRRVTREEILGYRDTYYHPDNMIIVLAGNIPSRTFATVKKRFGIHPSTKAAAPAARSFVHRQASVRMHIRTKKTAQSHLALSFPAAGYTSKELIPLQVLSTILGGNMSSRLFINVRDKKGLCYYIHSSVSPYEDTGAFTIQAGFDTQRIKEAIGAISEEIANIRSADVSKEELHMAKENLIGKMSLRFEDSENIATWWARTGLFQRRWRTPQDVEADIQAVNARTIRQLALRHLKRSNANGVVVGPFSKRSEVQFKKQLQF